MKKVVVVNYGMGNIKSVMRGIAQVGSTAVLSQGPDDIRNADRVILPGVGAFEDGMNELRQRSLDIALADFIQTGRPLLGICLGMQMLLDESEEHGKHEGLGFIPGRVVQIPQEVSGVVVRKIPHIGWSALHYSAQQKEWTGSVLETTKVGDYFYFVHSFMANPDDNAHVIAQCEYEGLAITAVLKKDNITACQFHPEKSGPSGLEILDCFTNS